MLNSDLGTSGLCCSPPESTPPRDVRPVFPSHCCPTGIIRDVRTRGTWEATLGLPGCGPGVRPRIPHFQVQSAEAMLCVLLFVALCGVLWWLFLCCVGTVVPELFNYSIYRQFNYALEHGAHTPQFLTCPFGFLLLLKRRQHPSAPSEHLIFQSFLLNPAPHPPSLQAGSELTLSVTRIVHSFLG